MMDNAWLVRVFGTNIDHAFESVDGDFGRPIVTTWCGLSTSTEFRFHASKSHFYKLRLMDKGELIVQKKKEQPKVPIYPCESCERVEIMKKLAE